MHGNLSAYRYTRGGVELLNDSVDVVSLRELQM